MDRPPKPLEEWDEIYATTDKVREVFRLSKDGITRCVMAREMGDRLELRVRQGDQTIERRTCRGIKECENYLMGRRRELEEAGWMMEKGKLH